MPDGPLVFDPYSARAHWRIELSKLWAMPGFWTSIGRGLSDAVDFVRPSDEEFYISLYNKLAMTRVTNQRAKRFIGRAYNKLVGEHPGYIQISGAHLRHALAFTPFEVNMPVDLLATYCLRQDVAEAALVTLKKSAHS